VELYLVISDDGSDDQAEDGINHRQHEFQPDDVGKMLFQQESMLRNVPVIIIGDPQVKQDIEDHGEVEQGEIESIFLGTDHVLDCPVDAQHPERLNQ
jgi:hypothetical protein